MNWQLVYSFHPLTCYPFCFDCCGVLTALDFRVPDACQIATFSLLVLFYAKLVHRHRWNLLRVRFLAFCILSNAAMVMLTVAYAVVMDKILHDEEKDPDSQSPERVLEFVTKLYFLICAAFFGVLVLLAAYYIRSLWSSRQSTAGTSKQEVLVTSFIFLIFLSRCIWDVLAAIEYGSDTFTLQVSEDEATRIKFIDGLTFALLWIWEIIPTLSVIVYFRNIPYTADSHCIGQWRWLNEWSGARKCLEGWPCNFPDEYFEGDEADESGQVPPPRSDSLADEDELDVSVSVSVNDPYRAMEDATSGESSLLPPGAFIRSAPPSHVMAFGGGSMYPYGMGGGYGTGSMAYGQNGVDVYGNATNWPHPALHQPLNAAAAAAASSFNPHYAAMYGQSGSMTGGGSHEVGVGYSSPYAHHRSYYGYASSDYPAHPYTQQQQQAAAARYQQAKGTNQPADAANSQQHQIQ